MTDQKNESEIEADRFAREARDTHARYAPDGSFLPEDEEVSGVADRGADATRDRSRDDEIVEAWNRLTAQLGGHPATTASYAFTAGYHAALAKEQAARADMVETLQRISAATPNSTNSRTPEDMRSWYKAVADSALERLSSPSPEADAGGWRAIETAPHGKKLIVGFRNRLGNWRTMIGRYYEAGTLELAEGTEADDGDYARPGWYEESETHDDVLPIEPTHWLDAKLPAPPQDQKTPGEA